MILTACCAAPALWMLEREPKHHLRESEGQGLWLDARQTGADLGKFPG